MEGGGNKYKGAGIPLYLAKLVALFTYRVYILCKVDVDWFDEHEDNGHNIHLDV